MQKTNIGERIKLLRQQKGLSLRQLARLAGCSPSFISKLELNRASPTLANFEKICGALKMSIVDVLRDDPLLEKPLQAELQSEDRPLAMRWHSAKMRHLFPNNAPRPFTALQVILEVGGVIPPRASRRQMNQLAIALKGQVELVTDGNRFTLKPFNLIYFDISLTHEWRNLGDEPAELLLMHPYAFQLIEQEEENYFWSKRKDASQVFSAD